MRSEDAQCNTRKTLVTCCTYQSALAPKFLVCTFPYQLPWWFAVDKWKHKESNLKFRLLICENLKIVCHFREFLSYWPFLRCLFSQRLLVQLSCHEVQLQCEEERPAKKLIQPTLSTKDAVVSQPFMPWKLTLTDSNVCKLTVLLQSTLS